MLNTVFKKKVSVDLSWTPRLQGRRLDRLSIPSVPWGKSSQLCEPVSSCAKCAKSARDS